MWTFRLGSLFGINIRIHITFVLLIVIIALVKCISLGLLAALMTILFLLSIFGCILLHELGHSLMARHLKMRTDDIMLWPLGGIATIRGTLTPDKEIKIALAGPAVNFALAFILTPIAFVANQLFQINFFTFLVFANLLLAFFNLLPAFPMDGSKVYRATLEKRKGKREATKQTANISNYIALAVGIIGLGTLQFMLILLAFIFYIAGQEEVARVNHTQHVSFIYTNPRQSMGFYPSKKEIEQAKRTIKQMLHRLRR